MATNSTKPLSTTDTAAAVSGTPTSGKSLDFSFDMTMPRPRLSGDQLRHCFEALQCFKTKKLNSPQTIRQEFQTLQVEKLIVVHIC